MSQERECASCINFVIEDKITEKGQCAIGKRNGVTYGQYVCAEWRTNTNGGSCAAHRRGACKGNESSARH